VNDESSPSSAWEPPQQSPPPPSPPPAAGTAGIPAPPQPGWGGAPPAWGGPGGYAPSPKTNPLATISLIAGLVQFVCFYFIGAIVAIVTGHIARSQIKRSNGTQGGAGMALAGIILGYVGLALSVLAAVGIAVFFIFFADDVERATLRSDARNYVDHVQDVAITSGGDMRDPDVLLRGYVRYQADNGETITLADGTPIRDADGAAWEANRWRIELNGEFGADVCATIPANVGDEPVVQNGECGP
jgi:hypothetical protein